MKVDDRRLDHDGPARTAPASCALLIAVTSPASVRDEDPSAIDEDMRASDEHHRAATGARIRALAPAHAPRGIDAIVCAT